MLVQEAINAAIFASLLSNVDIIRIAGFASCRMVSRRCMVTTH